MIAAHIVGLFVEKETRTPFVKVRTHRGAQSLPVPVQARDALDLSRAISEENEEASIPVLPPDFAETYLRTIRDLGAHLAAVSLDIDDSADTLTIRANLHLETGFGISRIPVSSGNGLLLSVHEKATLLIGEKLAGLAASAQLGLLQEALGESVPDDYAGQDMPFPLPRDLSTTYLRLRHGKDAIEREAAEVSDETSAETKEIADLTDREPTEVTSLPAPEHATEEEYISLMQELTPINDKML